MSNAVDVADKKKRLPKAYKMQEKFLLMWVKELAWDMVRLRTVEVKSMMVGLCRMLFIGKKKRGVFSRPAECRRSTWSFSILT